MQNIQDPSSLRRGGRDVAWIDFGDAFETLITIFGFEVKGSTSRGKGTNGGKLTKENKTDDFINATDHGANAAKTILGNAKGQKEEFNQVKNDTTTTLYYGGKNNTLQKTEKSVNGKIVKIGKK